MKKLACFLSVATLALSTLAASPARADGLNPLTAYNGQTVWITVNPYTSGENNGTDYVGLTQVDATSVTGNFIGSFEAFCDDFTHTIVPPVTYGATVTPINTPILEQEAYYGMMFGSTPSGNSTLDSEIHELIWNYTAPAASQFALNSDMQALQAKMLANYQSVDYSNSYFLNAGGNGQSFMTTKPATSLAPTPEPPTLITLATGLLGMAGLVRRRMVAKAQA